MVGFGLPGQIVHGSVHTVVSFCARCLYNNSTAMVMNDKILNLRLSSWRDNMASFE